MTLKSGGGLTRVTDVSSTDSSCFLMTMRTILNNPDDCARVTWHTCRGFPKRCTCPVMVRRKWGKSCVEMSVFVGKRTKTPHLFSAFVLWCNICAGLQMR
jgi:hypothetical protein